MNAHFAHSGTSQAQSTATGISGTLAADGESLDRDDVSDSNSSPDEVRQPAQAVPSQKRRRVTRACDEVSLVCCL